MRTNPKNPELENQIKQAVVHVTFFNNPGVNEWFVRLSRKVWEEICPNDITQADNAFSWMDSWRSVVYRFKNSHDIRPEKEGLIEIYPIVSHQYMTDKKLCAQADLSLIKSTVDNKIASIEHLLDVNLTISPTSKPKCWNIIVPMSIWEYIQEQYGKQTNATYTNRYGKIVGGINIFSKNGSSYRVFPDDSKSQIIEATLLLNGRPTVYKGYIPIPNHLNCTEKYILRGTRLEKSDNNLSWSLLPHEVINDPQNSAEEQEESTQ